MNKNFLVLTADGGGIKGLVPALLIQDLNNKFSILDKINLFGGTSAGGTIITGLAYNRSIDDFVNIFLNHGSTIFTPYKFWSDAQAGIVNKAEDLIADMLDGPLKETGLNLGDLIHVKYANTGLKKIFAEQVGDARLKDLRPMNVAAFQLEDPSDKMWRPLSLKNFGPEARPDFYAADAALCTSAAPTIFPPHFVEGDGYYADGGVFANNPCMLSLANIMASDILETNDKNFDNIRMISLGTGKTPAAIPPERIYDPNLWGMLAWMNPLAKAPVPPVPLITILLDGVLEFDSYQAKQFLGDNFRRANTPLPVNYPLDDWKNIQQLKGYVEEYMRSDEWQEISEWVGANFV